MYLNKTNKQTKTKQLNQKNELGAAGRAED